MLVVLAIIGVISAIALRKTSLSSPNIRANLTAQELAMAIREAQAMGTAGNDKDAYDVVTKSSNIYSYGISFKIETDNKVSGIYFFKDKKVCSNQYVLDEQGGNGCRSVYPETVSQFNLGGSVISDILCTYKAKGTVYKKSLLTDSDFLSRVLTNNGKKRSINVSFINPYIQPVIMHYLYTDATALKSPCTDLQIDVRAPGQITTMSWATITNTGIISSK